MQIQASRRMFSSGKSVEAACEPGGVTHFLQPKVHFTTTTSSKSGTNWLLAQLDFALFVENHYPYLGWSCWDVLMQKIGFTVASVWCGKGAKGFRSHGKQILKNHGFSKVEVSSAAPENNIFLPTFRKGKAWKHESMEKSSQTSNRKSKDQPVLVPSYPYECLKPEFI